MEKEHVTIRNEKLFCLNCGGEFVLTFPLPVPEVTEKFEAFKILHKDCKKTWNEPQTDLTQSIEERIQWWFKYGDVGLSSKTMVNCFLLNPDFEINHPLDPDDFKRCYKLLQTIPEWKSELNKLKDLSKAWSNLVDNWETLTKMYEQNEKEQWKNYKEIGMYELMQKLIQQ